MGKLTEDNILSSFKPSVPLNCLEYFIRISYYAGIIPYRICWDDVSNTYHLRTNNIQRVACAITSILGTVKILAFLKMNSTDSLNTKGDYRQFVVITETIIFTLIHASFLKSIWFPSRHKLLVKLCETTNSFGRLLPRSATAELSWIKKNLPVRIIVFLFPISIIIFDVVGAIQVGKSYSKFHASFWGFPEYILSNELFQFLFLIFSTFGNIYIILPQLLFAVFSLFLSYNVIDFIEAIDDDRIAYNILDVYSKLKNITDTLNALTGEATLLFMVGTVQFYSNYSDVLMLGTGVSRIFRVKLIFSSINTILLYAIAVYPNCKMDDFNSWIFKNKNYSKMKCQEVNILLNEVNNNSIGVKGYGFFTVTLSFLGSVLGLTITYSLLKLQFHPSAN